MATSAATITAPGRLPEAKPIDGFLAISVVAVLAVCVRAIWFTPVEPRRPLAPAIPVR